MLMRAGHVKYSLSPIENSYTFLTVWARWPWRGSHGTLSGADLAAAHRPPNVRCRGVRPFLAVIVFPDLQFRAIGST